MIELLDKRQTAAVFLLLIIMSIGFHIRYDNLNHWLENKTRYFSPIDNTPVTLAVDSYYYLDIAKDFLNGNLEKSDSQRQTPNSFTKQIPLPLLSFTLALISKITGKSLEWIAILLPPFLAVLLAIPVFLLSVLLFRLSGYSTYPATPVSVPLAGLSATLFALISPAFVERSSIGWCDTDILNVTLLCSLTFVALHAAIAKTTRELIFSLTAFTLLTGFFLLWWDMAIAPVTAFSLSYFFLAAFFSIARQRNNYKVFAIYLVVLCLLFFSIQGESLLRFPGDLINMIKYTVSRDITGTYFLHAGQLVAEQQDVSFAEFIGKIAGNKWIFYLSFTGIVSLALITRKYFLFLLPWLILSILTTRSHRLMIFPGVLFGLGVGTIVFLICTYLKKINFLKLLPIIIALFFLAWFPYTKAQTYSAKVPKRSPQLFDGFKQIATKIPAGSIIWTSWGNGHPLVFYTQAKTIGDGIFHPPELVYSQYVPFAATNFRLAANWISFYSTHGLDGLEKTNQLLAGKNDEWAMGIPALQELLGQGIKNSRAILLRKYKFSPHETEEFLSFIYPLPLSPIYFLLDYITYEEQWFPWGSTTFTDTDKKNQYTMVPIYSFTQSANKLQGKSPLGDISFDLSTGIGKVGKTGIQLKQLKADNSKASFARSYNTLPWASTLLLNQNMIMKYGALVDDKVLNTVFTKMFFLKEYDAIFFQPVFTHSPLVMLYQVKGEVYHRTNE